MTSTNKFSEGKFKEEKERDSIFRIVETDKEN